MKNKIIKAAAVISMSLLLTGCWDSIEIDRKAFIDTIAIDIGNDIDKKPVNSNPEEEENTLKDLNIVRVTYNFPDIRNMDKDKGTTEKLSLSVDGYSLSDAYIKAISKASRNFHFGHSKLLMVSDEVYGYPALVTEFVDYIQRTPSINRSMMMVIVEGKTTDFLAAEPLLEDGVDSYITNLLANGREYGSIKPVTVTRYIDKADSGELAIIPLFTLKDKNDIELTGAAVIKDNRIKEKLSNEDMDNICMLNGSIGSSKKMIISDNHPIDYYIKDVESDMDVKLEQDKLKLTYNISAEGDLSGFYSEGGTLEDSDIKNIEQEFDRKIEEDLLSTINSLVKEKNLDVIEVKNKIIKYHPSIARQIGDDWDRYIGESEIVVNVQSRIRTVGISN